MAKVKVTDLPDGSYLASFIGWGYNLNSLSGESREHALLALGYTLGAHGVKKSGDTYMTTSVLDSIEIEES